MLRWGYSPSMMLPGRLVAWREVFDPNGDININDRRVIFPDAPDVVVRCIAGTGMEAPSKK